MYACLVIADAPVAPAASPPPANDPGEALVSTAREFSPRVERVSARAVVCDVDGLERLFGDARAIASELRREAADRGVIARVAVAATRGAALLLAHARPGLTIVDPGTEAAMLAPLAIRALDAVSGVEVPPADASPPAPPARFYRTSPMQDIARAHARRRSHGTASAVEARARYASMMETFVRWGVRTLGDLAELPAAMRDARVLRTLALLDLESHPPGAGIDGVTVRVEPTPGRVLQFSLLERALPAPEQLSTLVARLSALMGQDRCGSARTVDTHRPGAFAMVPFAVEQTAAVAAPDALLESVTSRDGGAGTSVAVAPALRRFRHPLPIRVQLAGARPARVAADRTGIPTGHVEMAAGPWRSSGDWWAVETGREGRFGADLLPDTPAADAASRDTNARDSRAGGPVVHLADPSARPQAWNRDEWDVALDDGTLCRIYRDRDGRGWFME